MRALNHAELTTVDLHSELRFTVVRYTGWLDMIALPLLLGLPVRLTLRFLGLLLTDKADLKQLVAQ